MVGLFGYKRKGLSYSDSNSGQSYNRTMQKKTVAALHYAKGKYEGNDLSTQVKTVFLTWPLLNLENHRKHCSPVGRVLCVSMSATWIVWLRLMKKKGYRDVCSYFFYRPQESHNAQIHQYGCTKKATRNFSSLFKRICGIHHDSLSFSLGSSRSKLQSD